MLQEFQGISNFNKSSPEGEALLVVKFQGSTMFHSLRLAIAHNTHLHSGNTVYNSYKASLRLDTWKVRLNAFRTPVLVYLHRIQDNIIAKQISSTLRTQYCEYYLERIFTQSWTLQGNARGSSTPSLMNPGNPGATQEARSQRLLLQGAWRIQLRHVTPRPFRDLSSESWSGIVRG